MTNDHFDSFLNSSLDFRIEARLRVPTIMLGFITDFVLRLGTCMAAHVTLQTVSIQLRSRDQTYSMVESVTERALLRLCVGNRWRFQRARAMSSILSQ
jgi:hypothetical protein